MSEHERVFHTDVFSVEAVYSAEQKVMREVSEGTLMQRAAYSLACACARLLRERRGRVYGSRVVILAGGGINGGDAVWAGEYLSQWGARVHSVSVAHGEQTPVGRFDVVLDGIAGIGVHGPLRDAVHPYIEFAQQQRAEGACVVAVDLPSGVNPDTGVVMGPAITAHHTVTFGALKPGLLLSPGCWNAGTIQCVDIGILSYLGAPTAQITTEKDVQRHWPRPTAQSSKYTRGVLGVVAGSHQYPGAALLASAGALAGPVGMLRYVGPLHREVVVAHPEAIVSETLDDVGRVQAWVIGPGIGRSAEARTRVEQLIARDLPLLLDADALALLDDALMSAVRRRTPPTVLTPHEGEFTRLFGPVGDRGRLRAAQDAARFLRATVVLKGDRTLTVGSDEDAPACVGPEGAYALATAGTGDVLAGLIGSLLAAGLSAQRAAALGVFCHAEAGKRAAQDDASVTASTVARALTRG